MNKETVIGIDLGTGFSVVSIYENGTTKVIENTEGTKTTPSVVTYGENEISVGIAAKRQAVTNPRNTVYEVKRLMGRKFNDPDIKKLKKTLPYDLVEAKNGDVWVKIGEKSISPQEISAEILRKMKKTAEDYLGYSVTKAVITVPAYFNDSERNATKDAGTIAGLEVLRIINEPTAAILAMEVDSNISDDHKVMVIDTGSGTTDISIIEIASINGEHQYEVLSTSGDGFLGGSNFDDKIIHYLNDEFMKENAVDLLQDPIALQRLKLEAEKAKIELSSALQTTVNLPYITADATGPKHLNVTLTRAKFESMIEDLIDRTIAPCKIALKDAKLKMSDIVEVVLVGGTSRIPRVQEAVEKFTGKSLRKSVNVDECVAIGASIQGAILAGDKTDVLLLDVTPLSLGIETAGGVFANLINKNTTIPTKHTQVFSTASDNQPAVTIRVAQGEREVFEYNKLLGEFNLVDITPAPKGVPQIEITLDIDANGILHVSAKDKATGKENNITIKSDSGLTDEEIQKMIRDGEENAEADKKFKVLVESKNSAESALHSIKKDFAEVKEKLTEEEITLIEESIKSLEEVWVGDDSEVINVAVSKLYESAGPIFKAKTPVESESPDTSEGDDIEDAEFTETK